MYAAYWDAPTPSANRSYPDTVSTPRNAINIRAPARSRTGDTGMWVCGDLVGRHAAVDPAQKRLGCSSASDGSGGCSTR